MPETVYTVAEVASRTGINTRTIQRHAADGIGFRLNSEYRFRDADVAAIQSRERGPGRPRSVPRDEITRRLVAGETVAQIVAALGVCRTSVYQVKRKIEGAAE